MNWITGLLYSTAQLDVLLGLLIITSAPLAMVAGVACAVHNSRAQKRDDAA